MLRVWRVSVVCVVIVAASVAAPALAQNVGTSPQVNPGAIQNQQQRQQRQLEQQQQPQLVPQGPVVSGPSRTSPELRPGGPNFLLKGVTFDSSAFLTPDELKTIAAPYVGQEANFAKLQELLKKINALYDKKGIITASAILPPQKIADGVVHIGLVEGKLGKVNLLNRQQTNEGYVRNRVPLTPGATVDVPALTKSIEFFNRNNDTQLKALLQPGASFGQTDVTLSLQEPPRNTIELFADNQGVDTTGQKELGLYYRRAGLLGIDDRATLYGTFARGSLAGSAAYNLPVDIWGDRLGISYQRNRISIINGPFKTLDIVGTSQIGEVDFTHPFYATRKWFVTGNLNASDTFSKTHQTGVIVADDQTRKAGVGLTVTNSGNDHTFSITQSYDDAHSRDNVLSHGRYFQLYNGTWNGFLDLPFGFNATTAAGWQYTQQKLLPGDQLFSIGGPTTVRGYEANTFAGDDGYYVNLEFHHPMIEPLKQGNFPIPSAVTAIDAYVFGDRGGVYSTFPQERTLESIGFGLSATLLQHWVGEASVGFPLLHGVADQSPYVLYGRISFRFP